MATTYLDKDADLAFIRDRTVGIIGYGNQGRAQALNLKDSGIKVIVGGPPDAATDRAKADGFAIYSIAEASRKADILFLLLPDEVLPQVYKTEISGNLRPQMVLNFASGYNIAFKRITPPANVDVVLVGPRMIGKGVRDTFLSGIGFPSLVAVGQDASGHALQIALAIAKGIGSTRMGALLSSFEEETMVDLFTEHVGGVYFTRLMFEVLVGAGWDPEVVLLELYASGEGVESATAAREMGLWSQIRLHSRTSQYGQQVTSLRYLDPEGTRAKFRMMLEHIQNGGFAKEWQEEQEIGLANLKRVTNENLRHAMQKAENQLYRKLRRREEDLDTADWL